jgi:hypothetical protein
VPLPPRLVAVVLCIAGVAGCGGAGPSTETAAPGLRPSTTAATAAADADVLPDCPPAGDVVLSWLPADLTLPEGSYVVQELPNDTAGARAAGIVAPIGMEAFYEYARTQWATSGWTTDRVEWEPGETEAAMLRGPESGWLRMAPCGDDHVAVVLSYWRTQA